MIPNNFNYYKPDTLEESQNRNPVFYSGGSEIITMARASSIAPTDVIDLKGIEKCQELKIENNELIIGSCVTLSRIKESKMFPLLGLTCRKSCRPYKSK